MGRLNVVSEGDDRELDAIRTTIEAFEDASGLDDMLALLRRHSERGLRAELLDVIGHSCSHGFLVIGSWVIDDSPQTAASFGQLLRPTLERLGVHTIRLLGCSTATSDRGRGAMRRIAQVTRRRVFGTKRYISKSDYGPGGFIRDESLVGVGGVIR